MISFAPFLRPYDIWWMPESSGWKRGNIHSPCPIMGIDITIAAPRTCSSRQTASAQQNIRSHYRHLQLTEKNKLLRAKRYDQNSDNSIPGEDVIAELLDLNHLLIPGAIDPFGDIGPALRRLLYGVEPMQPGPTFNHKKPMARAMFQKAYSPAAPSGILQLANEIWTRQKEDEAARPWYGENYLEPCPCMWATQQLGLGIVRPMANHIRYSKFRSENNHNTNTFVE